MEELKQQTSVEGFSGLNERAQSSGQEVAALESPCLKTDLVCLSHLRWDFVYQRPQHLLSRFAKHRRVFFVEEPVFEDIETPRMNLSRRADLLHVATPHLPKGLSEAEGSMLQRELLDEVIATFDVESYTLWYYTPMALNFTRHLNPDRVIFDCMDELSAFRDAPQSLLDLEQELFNFSDCVFTGGHSLYEAKKGKHSNVHAFPSGIDYSHFSKARHACDEPADQKNIPHPRVGFFGVIDERADLNLIRKAAELRPDWNFVMIGPVVKIDPVHLPTLPNIHYLGMKAYTELPSYLAHWDLAMLPFALNESTRFISPTKTPEYLAAGKPVVSTGVRDVIRPYGEEGLVHIIETAEQFIVEGERAMGERKNNALWLKRVDQFLSKMSWDQSWSAMADLERSIDSAGAVGLSRPVGLAQKNLPPSLH